MRCDVLAQGVVDAAKEINIGVPLVVRLAGTNFKEGKEILDNSGLKLISAENLEQINYELIFYAGDYLKKQNINLKNIFLDLIPIRFYVHNRYEHYHVPLLLSPFGYSTYRGS